MALTPAEKMKRYRAKLKKDEERYKEYKKKDLQRIKPKNKSISELSESRKEKLRKTWRDQKRKQKIKQTEIQANRHPHNERLKISVSMALKAAEKQKRYRERIKKDPLKNALMKKKDLERIKNNLKMKKIADMTEAEKVVQREIWRNNKIKQKQKQKRENAAIEKNDSLHRFPKPEYPSLDRFEEWKDIIGPAIGLQEKDDFAVYNNYRICDKHFDDRFVYPSSKRLAKTTLPTTQLHPNTRKEWMKAIRRADPIGPKTNACCCEDHFNMENDMGNYVKHNLVGVPLKLKKDIVPHKFACQNRLVDKPERPVIAKLKTARLKTKAIENIASTSHDIEQLYIDNPVSVQVQNINIDPLENMTGDTNIRKKKHIKIEVNMKNKISNKGDCSRDSTMEMSKSNNVKACIVPQCTNTSETYPKKLFFTVPRMAEMRKKWLLIMDRRAPLKPSMAAVCCEDHFDLKNDLENYMKYRLVGGQCKLRKDVVPRRFSCQRRTTAQKRPANDQQRITVIYDKSIDEYIIPAESADQTPDPLDDFDYNEPVLPASTKKNNLETARRLVNKRKRANDKENDDVHCLTCDSCKGIIRGFRYKCVQCVDFNLCAKCEGKSEHPLHLMLRIPRPLPSSLLRIVLTPLQNLFVSLKEEPVEIDDQESAVNETSLDSRSIKESSTCPEDFKVEYFENELELQEQTQLEHVNKNMKLALKTPVSKPTAKRSCFSEDINETDTNEEIVLSTKPVKLKHVNKKTRKVALKTPVSKPTAKRCHFSEDINEIHTTEESIQSKKVTKLKHINTKTRKVPKTQVSKQTATRSRLGEDINEIDTQEKSVNKEKFTISVNECTEKNPHRIKCNGNKRKIMANNSDTASIKDEPDLFMFEEYLDENAILDDR